MILQDMTTATHAELVAQIEAMKAENDKLKNKAQGGLKVSEKGGVSVYGLGRFPVTLYPDQWQKLAQMMPEVLAFIEANKAKLSTKD